METPLKTQLLLAHCTLRPLVRAGDGPEMIQSGSISHISINPIVLSGWVSTRSLCLPAQVAEQCLLLSQVFTPDCLGFGFWFLVFGFRFSVFVFVPPLRKSAPLAGVLLVPGLGRAGRAGSAAAGPTPLAF